MQLFIQVIIGISVVYTLSQHINVLANGFGDLTNYIGVADIRGKPAGYLRFYQKGLQTMTIKIVLVNCEKFQQYELWIHTRGDVRGGCVACGGFFEPTNETYYTEGGQTRKYSQVSQFTCGANRIVSTEISDDVIKLTGPKAIVGRSVVIHAKYGGELWSPFEDFPAGKRLSCGVIGKGKSIPWEDGTFDNRPRLYIRV